MFPLLTPVVYFKASRRVDDEEAPKLTAYLKPGCIDESMDYSIPVLLFLGKNHSISQCFHCQSATLLCTLTSVHVGCGIIHIHQDKSNQSFYNNIFQDLIHIHKLTRCFIGSNLCVGNVSQRF